MLNTLVVMASEGGQIGIKLPIACSHLECCWNVRKFKFGWYLCATKR